jgi:CBS domain-containing protein
MHSLGQLAVRVKPLHPVDSLGKAAEALRSSALPAAPVVEGGRIIGIVTARSLADYLAQESPEELKDATVACLPLEGGIALPETLPPTEALRFFHANGLECAPVVDAGGNLLGLVSSAALASAVCGRIRPPIIGGMATPFGVYLTGGGVRGGVGDWALTTTGMFMAATMLLAACLTDWALAPDGLARWAPALEAWLAPLQASAVALTLVPFALLFRLSWVTGYHAAEHQVVHTIEAGDELEPEVVRAKPRVHPRCGTNLVAAVSIMGAFWSLYRADLPPPLGAVLQQFDALMPVVAMLVTFILWRRVGGWLQQHVTTRPATLRQLESGIAAGRELKARYQQAPPTALTPSRRLWNMGLLQVFAGWAFVFGIATLWAWLLPGLAPPALKGLSW